MGSECAGLEFVRELHTDTIFPIDSPSHSEKPLSFLTGAN